MDLESALAWARRQDAQYEAELNRLLAIPSVSTLPEHRPDVERAAQWVSQRLGAAGMEHAAVIASPRGGHPLVYADWLHAPQAPVVLCYGHYDVQPADPWDEWRTPPFAPAVREEKIYARGAADDKGPMLAQIQAAEACLRGSGTLPVNLKFLIEGEEEVGGETIEDYLRQQAGRLACDAVLITDTTQFAAALPTLTIGLRGMVYAELRLQGADADLHSGLFGGVAPNPLEALARIICGLKSAEGRIQIPGFYDQVRPPSAAERADWARLPFDPERYRAQEVRAPALTGEADYGPLERLWARPTLEVHGLPGGFTGAGGKTVIPARAAAKISMRLVPDQIPQLIATAFERQVRALTPPGIQAEVEVLHTAEPLLVSPDNRFVRAAAAALGALPGPAPVAVRSGGSIPIAPLFARELRAAVVMLGFATPDCGAHAPNEFLPRANFRQAREGVLRFFCAAGAA